MRTKEKHIRYMSMCLVGAIEFGTCKRANYYAILIDSYGHQIGSGYNGVPSGMTHCIDGGCPKAADIEARPGDYNSCKSLHAELNCLLHADYTSYRSGGTMYVNGRPCFNCAKAIANSGITEIVYLDDGIERQNDMVEQFMQEAKVKMTQLTKQDIEQI